MAPSASKLNAAIEVLVHLLVVSFMDLDFKTDWSRGKTECSVLYTGAGANAALGKWHLLDGWYITLDNNEVAVLQSIELFIV
eukprot:2174866-Karenia_brevis.AAC.1